MYKATSQYLVSTCLSSILTAHCLQILVPGCAGLPTTTFPSAPSGPTYHKRHRVLLVIDAYSGRYTSTYTQNRGGSQDTRARIARA